MSRLTFTAKRENNTLLISAESFDGNLYQGRIDNFTTSQQPKQIIIEEACICYAMSNIVITKYTPSANNTIPCTLPIYKEIYIEFSLQKINNETKHKTPIRIIDIVELPTRFDYNTITHSLIYKYVEAALCRSTYIDEAYHFYSNSTYDIKETKSYSSVNAPSLDDIRIVCARSEQKIVLSKLAAHYAGTKYNNTRFLFEECKSVFDTPDTDGLFSTEPSGRLNSNIILNPKVALLIYMVALGWRLINIDLYKHCHTITITVYKTNDNVSLEFSINTSHEIATIDDLYPNKFTWIGRKGSSYIPQRVIGVNMYFKFSNRNCCAI